MSHTLHIDFRPDNYPEWIGWREFNQLSTIQEPSRLGRGGLPDTRAGFYPRLSFGKPQVAGDRKATGRKFSRCYNVQIRFRGTGYVVLDRFRLHAQKLIERSTAQNKP